MNVSLPSCRKHRSRDTTTRTRSDRRPSGADERRKSVAPTTNALATSGCRCRNRPRRATRVRVEGPALPELSCYDPKYRDRLICRRQASSASASLPHLSPSPGRLPGNSVKYRRQRCDEKLVLDHDLRARRETHAIAKAELFDYIEVFYNQERRHSTLGYVRPGEFERAARMEQAAA